MSRDGIDSLEERFKKTEQDIQVAQKKVDDLRTLPQTASGLPGASASSEEVIPAGVINFPLTDLKETLKIYSELVGREILSSSVLPSAPIVLKTQGTLTKREAIQALDAVLALNGIAAIPVGDKSMKIVGSPQANQTGSSAGQENKRATEVSPYVTQLVQLRHV